MMNLKILDIEPGSERAKIEAISQLISRWTIATPIQKSPYEELPDDFSPDGEVDITIDPETNEVKKDDLKPLSGYDGDGPFTVAYYGGSDRFFDMRGSDIRFHVWESFWVPIMPSSAGHPDGGAWVGYLTINEEKSNLKKSGAFTSRGFVHPEEDYGASFTIVKRFNSSNDSIGEIIYAELHVNRKEY